MDVVRTPVREFGLSGLIEDVRPWDVPTTSFTKARNVRIEDASLSTLADINDALGPFTDDATGTIAIKPIYKAPFWLAGSSQLIIVMDNGEVRAYSSLNVYTLQIAAGGVITSAPFYHVQSGQSFHLVSVANLPKTLFAEDVATPLSMVDQPGWPSTYRCGVMEAYKNTLVASEIEISGVAQPNLVKWSDFYSEGDGSWDWDQTSTTNSAGENYIQSDGQGVIGLQPLRDSMIVYFDRSVFRMALGGPLVMSFQRVFSDDGMLSKYARDTVGDRALVVGLRDIYLHDGVQKRSLSDGRLTRFLASELQIDYPVWVRHYPRRNETWITYRTKATGNANKCLIYNSIHDSFTPLDLTSETSSDGDFIGLCLGPRLRGDFLTYATVTGSYADFDNISYSDVYSTSEDTVFYGLSADTGTVLDLDVSGNANNRFKKQFFLEHSRIDLKELLQTSGDNVVYLSRLFPRFSGNGTMQVRIGTSNLPDGSIQWGPWVDFVLAEDYAIDLRAAGRYLAYQMRPLMNTAPAFSLSGLDIEWAVVGER